MHRLVTFLGTGEYQPTRYAFTDRDPAPATPWIAQALNWLLDPRPKETVVIATDKAWDKNGPQLCEAFRASGLGEPRRVPIPEGRTEAELWDQFEQLKRALRVSPEDLVTVDITHALRHQPFFAAGIISFVRMVDPEYGDMRVVYGAFEMAREGVAPILELTPFVDLIDWTRDLVLFLESGRIGRLVERTETLGRMLRKRWADAGKQGEPPRIREFADAVEAFARDLQTIRTGALLLGGVANGRRTPSSAKRLREAVAAARADMERHLPPLADVLDRIEAMAERLDFDGDALVGEKARDVLAALADLYLEMGRHVEAITLLREARITAFCPPAAACPGLPNFDDGERNFVERKIWFEKEHDRARAIADVRNDIDHAGFRRDPLAGTNLIEEIEKQREDFGEIVFPPSPHAGRVLVNITNHPWKEWPEDQRKAALALVERVEDLPFPKVGPQWGLGRLEREADALVEKLPPGTTHALVQGEFTLTMALVKRLQARGIRCLAATSERRVSRTEDGRELREFRFVRFRDYPPLA